MDSLTGGGAYQVHYPKQNVGHMLTFGLLVEHHPLTRSGVNGNLLLGSVNLSAVSTLLDVEAVSIT